MAPSQAPEKATRGLNEGQQVLHQLRCSKGVQPSDVRAGTITSPVARYQENTQTGLFDLLNGNLPAGFTSTPDVLDQSCPIGVHHAS